jgi:hypothetical protein
MLGKINARITYAIASSEPIGFSEVTGEPIFSETTATIEASLETDSDPTVYDLPGVENIICKLSGNQKGTVALKAHEFYPIQIDLQGETKTGRFYALPSPSDRLVGSQWFGTPLRGILVGTA